MCNAYCVKWKLLKHRGCDDETFRRGVGRLGFEILSKILLILQCYSTSFMKYNIHLEFSKIFSYGKSYNRINVFINKNNITKLKNI